MKMPGLIHHCNYPKLMIMKTLKNILLGIMVSLIMPVCIAQTPVANKQVITLKSVTEHAAPALLAESKAVLLRRLEGMKFTHSAITVVDGKSELIISVSGTITTEALSELLLTQGNIRFYSASAAGDTLKEQDIREAHADLKHAEYPTLCITFKDEAWKRLEELSILNMKKPLAFAVDNKVLSSPGVMDTISQGKISLTGSGFTQTEVRKLAAIITAGPLPLKFIVTGTK
jgi:hypothetical protein